MANNSKLTSMKVGSREHVEFSRLLVNTIQEYAIFLLDTTGHIVTWNPGAQKLKGYSADEIIGKHFSVFYPEVDIRANKPGRELEIATAEGHVEDEGWRIKKDGSKFWANVVITALRDDNHELVGYAKVTRDLSIRKKYEERLYHANLRLKRQSTELWELNNTKDEFITMASHQLRTPASGVKQFLGLLIEGYAGKLSTKQMDFLQRAYDSNERQIELINDLLRVAQVDAGKITLKPQPVILNELVEDIAREHRDMFKNRQQKLTLRLPTESIVASVDIMWFRMVIENLVDNASKYTPSGGKIAIELSSVKNKIVIDVIDTGVGVDKESFGKLFTKFSRIQNYLSDSVGGSGLGLYWAYKITALHKGSIGVKSLPGQGSIFTITIPKGKRNA